MFYHSISRGEMATQVAGMLNSFNGLSTQRTSFDVERGSTNYVVETEGKFVIAAVGIDRQGYTFTEIKHLVVRPEHRGRGIAKYLVRQAMKMADTKMLYATVREDNEASLRLFELLGFVRSNGYKTKDHSVILLVRATPSWEKEKPSWKSTLSSLMSGSPFHQGNVPPHASEGMDIAQRCLKQLGTGTGRLSVSSTSLPEPGFIGPSTSKT